jgi:hypothetical protein
MASQFWPIDVEYDTRRTVYVTAETEAQARTLALDTTNWADAEEPDERMETLRLAGEARP